MQIVSEQLVAIEGSLLDAFDARTLAHLQRYYPRHCALLGEQQMRRVIRHGLHQANSYGLEPECCVRSYIDLMCLLGGWFDEDLLLPWAGALLRDRSESDAIVRGDALYDRAWAYIHRIMPDFRQPDGTPSTARFVYEFRELRDERDEPVTPVTTPAFAQGLEARLKRVFPAKYECVGALPVRRSIVEALTAAPRHGIRGSRGITLYAALMFLLGTGFAKDPLLPWVSAVLIDPALQDEKQKVDKLFMSAVHVLRQWWDPELGKT